MALRAKQLKGLRITENSGVDAPAHLGSGWIVMKSADDQAGDDDLDAFVKQLLDDGREDVPAPARVAAAEAARQRAEQRANSAEAALAKKVASLLGNDAGGKTSETPTRSQAWRAVEDAARDVEKAATSAGRPISRPEAIAKATEFHPELLEAYYDASPDPEPQPVAKAVDPAWEALQKAADALRATNPRLPLHEAIAKAGDEHPELLRAYEAASGFC